MTSAIIIIILFTFGVCKSQLFIFVYILYIFLSLLFIVTHSFESIQ